MRANRNRLSRNEDDGVLQTGHCLEDDGESFTESAMTEEKGLHFPGNA